MSSENKKIISRLILQKILASTATQWMKVSDYESISKCFLSETPDKETYIRYLLKKPGANESAYGNEILTLSIKWIDHEGEILDPEGNVWKTCQLKLSPSISSTYGDKEENFSPRVDCLFSVKTLLDDIREMIPGTIRTMILNNDERIARDLKRKYDAACDEISKFIRWNTPELRRGLRLGGKSRTFQREIFSKIKVEPGKYEFEVNDGSNKNPKMKKYSVTIPENPLYLCAIKRVS